MRLYLLSVGSSLLSLSCTQVVFISTLNIDVILFFCGFRVVLSFGFFFCGLSEDFGGFSTAGFKLSLISGFLTF